MADPVSTLNGQTPRVTELSLADQERFRNAIDDAFLTFVINMMIRQNDFSQELIKEAIDEAE